MYNTKFILSSGEEIYPGYLDKERREKLKMSFGAARGYMRCACKPEESLFYRISEDLKIYPEHNNYIHDKSCCRYSTKRQTAYVINEDDGDVTVFLTFNPKTFSSPAEENEEEQEQDNEVPEDADDENVEDIIIEKEAEKKSAEPEEPKLSLGDLIRSINVDTYTEKILNNRKIDSKEYFSKAVYFRMKKIRISRMKKGLGDLSLEKDGVVFFYLPVAEIVVNTVNDIKVCYIKTKMPDGKIYTNSIYTKTLETALKDYKKRYNEEPDENTMIAGFQYLKKGKAKRNYRVLGRIHLFKVSDVGIYCRNLAEQRVFNQLHQITKEDSNIRFWIPPDDESIKGYIEVKGVKKKLLLLFRSKKDENISYNPLMYVPCVISKDTNISKAAIYELLNEDNICGDDSNKTV